MMWRVSARWASIILHSINSAKLNMDKASAHVPVGGYEDDRDEGEWLLYTGSGGRDLSGNKRTNKEQSFDQVFEGSNKALLRSCERGLPVRVLRSYKEKRSAYAPTDPDWGIRYDGVYRIVAAWRHIGMQGVLSPHKRVFSQLCVLEDSVCCQFSLQMSCQSPSEPSQSENSPIVCDRWQGQ